MSTKTIEYEHRLIKKEKESLKDLLLEQLTEYDGVYAEKAEVVKEFSDSLKKLSVEIHLTRDEIQTGVQTRSVRCDRMVDAENGVVNYLDVITGEIRRSIPMGGEEDNQIGLEIGEQAEYIRIISAEGLPKKLQDLVGEVFKLENRDKSGKSRNCYFKDAAGVRRKISTLQVELYNWVEVNDMGETGLDSPEEAEEVTDA